MKQSQIKASYRLKVFLIYLIVTIVPILTFIGVVEIQYVEQLQEQSLDSLDNSCDTLVGTLDSCMEQIKSTVRLLIISDETKPYYLPEKPAEANEFRDRLAIYISDDALFSEIALYSADNDYLFSNYSSYTKERFLNLSGLQQVSIEEIDRILDETYGPVVFPAKGGYAFCVLYPLHIPGEQTGLFFAVPEEKLRTHIRTALFSNEGYCQLVDGNGQVLFSYSSDGVIPKQELIDRCAAGERSVRDGGKTLYCATSRSLSTGISANIIIRDGSVHQSISNIRWKWGFLIVISIVLSFVASWVTSFINTNPIVALSKKISSSNIREREPWTNELEHIEASIHHLNDFATTVRKQMDEVGDYLMFRLLCGTIESVDDANQLSQMLGTSIYADAYQVCMVDLGEERLAGEVGKYIRNLLPPEISSLTRAFGSVYVCVFFCCLDDQNTMDILCEKFLCRYPCAKLSFGNSYSRLEDIPISFMEASLAIENEESAVTSFTYPDILRSDIEVFSQLVEDGNVAQILEHLQTVCKAIECTYTLSEGKCVSVRLFHLLSDSTLAGRLPDALPNPYVVISADTPSMLLRLFEPLVQQLRAIQQAHIPVPSEPPLVEQMQAYLLANYRNPNFSLQQMAFDFRITPAMLSRYFKENYGQNINDYLNDLKMERARKLLLETNLPVYEVGLELGYQGPNSFIRRFKATYGITPGEFRQEALRQKNEL